jgi:hypothetical protein
MRYLKWLMARLEGPCAGRAVIAIALVLSLPSLFSPLVADDRIQASKWRASLDHAAQTDSRSILNDYFVFSSGDPAANRRAMEDDVGAWWMAPDWKLAFWRPLSAATHVLDQLLWPGNGALMHLHTLFWFCGMLYALYALYRRFLTPRIASLALALYAWDDARGAVLSFVANRNALIAGLCGISVIIAHDKWRRDGWRPGAWLAPLLLAVGLVSAEMAIATTAFLFGHALFVDQGSLARRMARLAPYLLVVVLWQAAYSAGGYGTQASGSYLHPLQEPLAYAAKLIERAPILSLGQLTPIASDPWMFYPRAVKVAVFLVALAVLVLVARIARPGLAPNPQARFWLVGAGLSLLPISAAFPGDRDLVFVGFGVAPALALVFSGSVENPPASRWPRFVIGALVVFNLALAPLTLPAKCLTTSSMKYVLGRTDESIPRDSAVSRKTLVAVWVASEASLGFNWRERDAAGIPKPGKTRILAVSLGDVSVTRLDEVTLRLRPADGFFASEFHQLTRGPSRPFRGGEHVELSNLTAMVTEITKDGRPKTVEFRFAAPLESPEWLWMRGEGLGLVGWTPPKIGETVVVRATR